MAQRVEILVTDDLDGSKATHTVRFALDGRELEIDLNDKNAGKLRKVLHPYVNAGRRLGSRTGTTRRTTVSAGSSGMTKEELANIRGWAKENGYEVSDKGRVKGDVLAAYHGGVQTTVAVEAVPRRAAVAPVPVIDRLLWLADDGAELVEQDDAVVVPLLGDSYRDAGHWPASLPGPRLSR